MFSLIITIISIALVAALAVATIYYGGSAFTQGTAKAQASALVSAGQQVSGALTLYANDNGGARALITDLTSKNYLSAAPSVKGTLAVSVAPAANTVQVTGVDASVCDQVNVSAGVAIASAPTDVAAALLLNVPYSCAKATAGATTGTFVFKG